MRKAHNRGVHETRPHSEEVTAYVQHIEGKNLEEEERRGAQPRHCGQYRRLAADAQLPLKVRPSVLLAPTDAVPVCLQLPRHDL